MDWTTGRKLQYLLRLPWTFVVSTTPEGDRLLRVAEIPSAVGEGVAAAELEADLWEALRAALSAYLHFNDPIPLPKGSRLPWTEATEVASITVVHQQAADSGPAPVPNSGTAVPTMDWSEQHVDQLVAA